MPRAGTPRLPRVGTRRPLAADAACVAAIAALVLLAFSPWWAGGRIIAPLDVLHELFEPWNGGAAHPDVHNHFTSDAVTQYVVYRRLAERSFSADGTLGWNDLTGGGRPDYANTMALYGDWTVQLHRWLDFWTAWHLGLMAQFLVAALGMYVLLRSRRILPLVSLTGAVAFAASTPLVYTFYHRWQLAAFAWIPWLAWATLVAAGGRRTAWPLVPAFLALALLGASLQTALFVLLVWMGLWAGALIGEGVSGRRVRLTAEYVVWGALGAGLAAFALVPAVLMYMDGFGLHAARSAPGYPQGWDQPLRSLLFIPLQVMPTLLGSARSLDLTKLLASDLSHVAFLGFIPTVVAMRAAFWARTPPAARLLILAGLLLPLTPLVGLLYHRVQVVFVFAGAWAFAWYWQHADMAEERWWRTAMRVAMAFAALWLLASAVLWAWEARITGALEDRIAARLTAGDGGQLAGFTVWMRARAGVLVHELRIWHPAQVVAVAGMAMGLVAVHLRRRGGTGTATLLLLAAIILQLGGLALGWHRAVDPARYPPYPESGDIRALGELARGGRVHIAATHHGPALFFPPNTLAMYDIPVIEQFETVDVPGMWQAAQRSADPAVLGRIGVTHAVAPPGAVPPAGWTVVYRGATLDVWSADGAIPRYVGVPGAAGAGAGRAAGPGLPVTIVRATPNRRVVDVPVGTAAVRVAENWSEGWQYRVGGGTWRAAERAGDHSMMLALPEAAGAVRVELRYRPWRRTVGRAVTGVAVVLTLAGALVVARRPRIPGRAGGGEATIQGTAGA
jgi:hypothetical protein